MIVQITFSLTHILWNYILVNRLEMGVIGTGLSSILTNSLILLGNIIMTKTLDDLKDAYNVSMFDK